MANTSIIKRAIAGTPLRKTRLHDEKGNFVTWSELAYLPVNVAFVVNRIAFDRYPPLPWFTFGMVRRIEKIVRRNWTMVEFGSGLSTIWFAKRVNFLHSIEHNPEWYERMRTQIAKLGIRNIRLELRPLERYHDLSEYRDGTIDFAVVDGQMRDGCMQSVLPKVKPGGYVYLDNSDKDMTLPDGHVRIAERLLSEEVKRRNGTIEQYTGLTVGLLSAHQGTLAKV